MPSLVPFQEIGRDFLIKRPYALLADEPGCGKTPQDIMAAMVVAPSVTDYKIVVCPASVRSHWKEQIFEWTGSSEGWGIISYNAATTHGRYLRGPFAVLTLDEFHFCKTMDSQRTQAILGNEHGIVRRSKRVWVLIGTNILNRPRELYPMVKTLGGGILKPYDTPNKYYQRYCGQFFNGRGLDNRGASHLDELGEKLSSFMLRRTKAEVLSQLPPVVTSYIPLELTSLELRDVTSEEDTIENREVYVSPTHELYGQLGDLAKLLRLTGLAKVNKVCAFVDDKLQTVDKVLIFAWHTDVVKEIHRILSGKGHQPVIFKGTDKQKDKAKGIFMGEESCRAIIGNIRTMGTGVDGFHKVCSTSILAEIPWVPGEQDQSIVGRLQRFGAVGGEGSTINAYILHAIGTLESAVIGSQRGKRVVIDRVYNWGVKVSENNFSVVREGML